MIVPEFWAEARLRERIDGRQVTIRRYGWSDESPGGAQTHAEDRARQAMARVRAGEHLPRRERKFAYNGADGLPIREEIVARYGEAVVTRNSYGALCLNTPNVLFIDIDLPAPPLHPVQRIAAIVAIACFGGVMYAAWGRVPRPAMIVIGFLTAVVLSVIMSVVDRRFPRRYLPNARNEVNDRIARFVAARREWRLRVYHTPAGFRLLVVHRLFDPLEPALDDCFHELRADPAYVRMCRNQRCFRARVSPKPWRVGIDGHIRPRPGVWPVHPERLPERQEWIRRYEREADGFAACRFVGEWGEGTYDPVAAAIVRVHDSLSRAETDWPIA